MALKNIIRADDIERKIDEGNNLLSRGDTTIKNIFNGDKMLKPGELAQIGKDEKTLDEFLKDNSYKIIELDIEDLSPSPVNMFSQVKNEKREEVKNSLKEMGQLTPIIVRPKACVEEYKNQIEKDYEILAGHTRVSLLKELGYEKVLADVRECSDYEATLIISHTNNQREKIDEIEKARAIKVSYEAAKRDDKLNLTPGNPKNKNVEISTELSACHDGTPKRTDELVAEQYGISARTLHRKIALASCEDEVLAFWKRKQLSQEHIDYISKLKPSIQYNLIEVLKDEGSVMTTEIAKNLLEDVEKYLSDDTRVQREYPLNSIRRIVAEGQGNVKDDSKVVRKKNLDKGYNFNKSYFPKDIKDKDRVKYIEAALKYILENNIELNIYSKEVKEEVEV